MSEGLYFEPPLQAATLRRFRQGWRQAGNGERLPLFLLHGIGSNARSWAGQFAGFCGERPVIAWNAPGYANSDCLSTEWPTPDDYAVAALALLDHLQIPRCFLVGQSLGAVMASALARRAPERIAAVVLASPAEGYASKPGAALPDKVAERIDTLKAWGSTLFAERRAPALLTCAASPMAHAIVRLAMSEIRVDGYEQAARLLATADLAADVGAVNVPMAVIWGGADVITPPERCRRIAAAAHSVGVELDGLGHGFATEAPVRFNDSLRPLIAAAEQGSAAWT